jgi:hypothetical protein
MTSLFMSTVRVQSVDRARLAKFLRHARWSLTRPIPNDIATGHIEFAAMIERRLSMIGLAERHGNE